MSTITEKPTMFISVIMPVYNVAKYLEKSINSILEQTYQNFELILIDDGSTDSSGNICDKYAQQKSNIKVIHQINQGQSVARNKGIDVATGNYICFLDSDDWYSSNALESLVETISNNDTDISLINIIETENENVEYKDKNEIIYLSSNECLTNILNNHLNFVQVCNKLYKKELFNKIKFPVGKIFEDEYISTDIYSRINKLAWTQKGCMFYRQRPGSTTKEGFNVNKLQEYDSLVKTGEAFKNLNRLDLWSRNLSRILSFLFKSYFQLKDSNLENKEMLMKDIQTKIIYTFNQKPIFKWRFKDIRRYYCFRISPKLFIFTSNKK